MLNIVSIHKNLSTSCETRRRTPTLRPMQRPFVAERLELTVQPCPFGRTTRDSKFQGFGYKWPLFRGAGTYVNIPYPRTAYM